MWFVVFEDVFVTSPFFGLDFMARRQSRAKRWVFTLNNYTDEDQQRLRSIFPSDSVDYLVFGREIGETGTPHLQGYIHFRFRQYLAQAKAVVSQRAHLEVSRGNPTQAADYCKKDGDFEEFGVLPNGQGSRTDLKEAQEWVRSFVEENNRAPTATELALQHPAAFIRYDFVM